MNSEKGHTAKNSRTGVYLLFALATIGAALGNLSQTGVNAMLPAIMSDFGISVDLGQWVTTGYMLMLGIAVPLATYLMRRLDDRGYLLLASGIFCAGSVLDWFAPEFFSMLLGRFAQAVSVGLLIPKMQTIAMTKFAPGRQATAMGVAGIALGFAPNIGPTVGGWLEFSFGWRSFFVLLTAVSAALIVGSLLFVKPNRNARKPATLEIPSFAYSSLGVGGVLLGLSQASSFGFLSPWVWIPTAVGALFLVLFVRRQGRVPQPLMNLDIFKSRRFVDGLVASVFLFACFMGVTLVIPLYVQDTLGGTSLDAGLVLLPATFTALIVNPLSGWLADKTSMRRVLIVFGAFLLVGSVACATIGDETPLALLSIYQTVRAIGVSGVIGPLLTYSLAGLDGPLVSHGSSTTVIVRQVSATFGTAFMAFFVAALLPGTAEGAFYSAFPYQMAFTFSAVMAVLCFVYIVRFLK